MKQPSGTHHGAPDWLRGSSRSAFDVVTSDPECYGTPHTGDLRPEITPLGRREMIRNALDRGDWRDAGQHLHTARETLEYRMVPGITSWRDYVETLPLSRMHDHRLRLIARRGTDQVCYTLRQAYAMARGQTLS